MILPRLQDFDALLKAKILLVNMSCTGTNFSIATMLEETKSVYKKKYWFKNENLSESTALWNSRNTRILKSGNRSQKRIIIEK